MTEDSFVFAMGGHSAAAGHGNLFQQSYTLQVQRVMEPVFARLGVYHEARNFGNGGLGTLHNALAAGSLYGPDVDVLMWDAGMTENNPRDLDLFARQGILGGSRVPVLWNLPPDTLTTMYVHADADVGGMFIKELPIPKAQNRTHLDELPYAIQYMKCDNSIDKDFCKPREYRGVCWIDRDDFVPTTPQNKHPGSRVSWHPGFRVHQFKGRILAFTLLEALKEALEYWNGLEDLVLPEDAWHVTAHYENIRNKVQNLDPSIGRCYKFEGDLPTRVCKYPMKGRTEYTPRAYPALSSIRSLMPTAMAASINPAEDKIYNPPDVYNKHLHPGFKAIDVVGISESGVDYRQFTAPSYESYYKSTDILDTAKSADLWEDPGKGITLGNHATDYLCDGTYNSFCNRGTRNKCLLSAHNDGRGGLLLDSFSGWMLLDIPNVEHGVIILNMEIWHTESPRTEGWTSVNNENVEQRGRSLSNSTVLREPSKRRASEPEEFFCDDFIFECSINEVLHRYNKQEFLVKKKKLQRVVTAFSLLDDESFRSEQVKLAFRLVGCARNSAIKVTHVYWA